MNKLALKIIKDVVFILEDKLGVNSLSYEVIELKYKEGYCVAFDENKISLMITITMADEECDCTIDYFIKNKKINCYFGENETLISKFPSRFLINTLKEQGFIK